jgi:hypothetical protein
MADDAMFSTHAPPAGQIMKRRAWYTAAVTFVLAMTTSCSDAPSAPSDRAAHDVSTAIAQTVAITFGTYFPGADVVGLPTTCPYSAATSEFVCAPSPTGELSYVLRYQLLDADGRPLSAPSARAATMRAVIDVQGTRTVSTADGNVTTSVVDHRELVVGGLHASARTISGTSTSHRDVGGTDPGVPHSVQDAVGDLQNIVVDDSAPWPRAGAMMSSDVTTVDASGPTPSKTLRSRSTIEFDGTSIVTITTSVGESTLRCRFDLAARVATTCS